ncbi:MAG: hypothetical protein AB7D39_02770 [Pseudodesulfovibrio sp.]|uniref:hypothetical protein n=1 Tax=Pseudodesulfovibrio sp. TaxID=2035812 RepID=UPI003D0E6000
MKKNFLSTKTLALGFTLLTTLAAALVFLFDPSKSVGGAGLMPEHVGFVEFDNTAQRHAHLATLFSVGVLGLFGTWLTFRKRLSPCCARLNDLFQRLWRPSILLSAIILLACFAENSGVGRDKWLLFLALGWTSFFLPKFVPALRNASWTIPFLYLLTAVMAVVPYVGLWTLPLDMTFFRIGWEVHSGCILGAANQVAGGMAPGVDTWIGYGVLFPMLFGLYQRTVGFLDIAGQQHVVLAFQGLLVVMLLCGWRLWNRRHPLYLLLPLLLIVPFAFTYRYLTYVNHTGIRFFNFAFVPLVFLLLRRVPRRNFLLGLVIGGAFAVNPETGIAIGLGACAFVVTGHACTQWEKIGAALIVWFVGVVSLLGGVAALISLTGGPGAYYFPFDNINRFSGGFAGIPLYFDSFALLMFLHAQYVAFRNAMAWGRGSLSFRRRFELLLSVALLVWFAYFAIRPYDTHLQTFFLLYSYLLIGMIDVRRIRLLWRKRAGALRCAFVPLPLLVVLVIVIPFTGRACVNALQTIVDARRLGDSVVVGGAHFAPAYGTVLKEKIAYLSAHKGEKPLLLTGTSYTVPLMTRYYPRHSFLDIYGMSTSMAAYRENLRSILEQKAPYLYFDDPADYPLLGYPKGEPAFYERIKRDVSGEYRKFKTVSGWEIWQRIPGGADTK